MQSINNTKTLTIVREYDKLCILEKLLNNNQELEKIVSNFIDTCCTDDCNQAKLQLFNILKDYINDFVLLTKIIKLTFTIIYDTPFEITILDNDIHIDLVKYLNQPYIPFLPNDYFYASS